MFGTPGKMSSQQKTPKGKGGNTLLNYFSKTQGSSQKANSSSSSQSGPTSIGKTNSNGKPSPNPTVVLTPTRQPAAPRADKGTPSRTQFTEGHLVMAQVLGHPFWPAVVVVAARKSSRKQQKVLFLGEHSHAWVPSVKIRAFNSNGARGGLATPAAQDEGLEEAMEEAARLSKLSVEQRFASFPKAVLSRAQVEEEEDEEEPMDVTEVSDDDKENARNSTSASAVRSKGMDESSDEEMPAFRRSSSRPSRRASSQGAAKRRKTVIASDSDDSDGYVPDKKEDSDDDDEELSCAEEDDTLDGIDPDDLFDEDDEPTPSRKRKHPSTGAGSRSKSTSKAATAGKTPVTPRRACSLSQGLTTPSSSTQLKSPSSSSSMNAFSAMAAASSLSKFQSPAVVSSPAPTSAADSTELGTVYMHETLDWIKDEKVKDAKGHLKSHPDYDPRTLYVPRDFLSKQSPAMQQWWKMKIDNYDAILFFKVGKFYELYHMDAAVGIKELGLLAMKGAYCHSGFPEIGFGRYSDQLVQKGYRVARVEQTETPQMLEERNKKTIGKGDKTVRREICSIVTRGTKTYNFMDADTSSESANAYLLAITEKASSECAGVPQYGVCFIDTTIGCFHIGQFTDDRQCSRLRTLVAHYPPVQVLYPRHALSQATLHILSSCLANAMTDCIAPGTEFWSATKTLKTLSEKSYFRSSADQSAPAADEEAGGEESSGQQKSSSKWPSALQKLVSSTDALGLSADSSSELAVSSLGALVWYLTKCGIAGDMLSMQQMQEYIPEDCIAKERLNETIGSTSGSQSGSSQPSFLTTQRHMVLDGVTLLNLEVLQNATDGSVQGSLYQRLDHCATPFGRRLLKQWLCSPLCHPDAINSRLDAVEALMDLPAAVTDARDILRQLPDLQRLLGKIHLLGSVHRTSDDHPDSRAIFYEETTYGKRKIQDFLTTLSGFVQADQAVCSLAKHLDADCKSALLRNTVCQGDIGKYPALDELINFFQNAFDHEKAKRDGVILPRPGVNKAYDAALRDVKAVEDALQTYLEQQRKRLGSRNVNYWGTGKNRFQLEVPDAVLSRYTPDDYNLASQKKGFHRYRTEKIEAWLEDLVRAEELRDEALRDTMRSVFASFDEHFSVWDRAVQCVAVLDVLMSLAHFSLHGDGPMCRPRVQFSSDGHPFLNVRDARHPCIAQTFSGDEFISNDTVIGVVDDDGEDDSSNGSCAVSASKQHSSCLLVTGPNMGGKSTLMRQTGIIVILAQLGCYVPAETCHLSPVDRLFTRLGASDHIMAGESTFFVELSETSTILQHSTKHSLVLLDELGRGTATFDGTAIASAVVHELTKNIGCRTLFSTHYHSLVDELASNPAVRLGHMACMVENEDEEDTSKETITFLYKFIAGACPKSYGFNAARLAGLSDEIIDIGHQKAKDFARAAERGRLFRSLMQSPMDNVHSSISGYRKDLQHFNQQASVSVNS
ncbi:DNA mismatch repair protein Msh6-like [Sycon ciliatum]|uniref:DNA mismatch repair protein Msh6-like n=1 Tax=Sycon ciliatum TaxID=27933 RepID=UPI0031F6991D